VGNYFNTNRKLCSDPLQTTFCSIHNTLTTHSLPTITARYLWVITSIPAENYTITTIEYGLHHHYLWVITSIPTGNYAMIHYRLHHTPYTLHYSTLTTHYATHYLCVITSIPAGDCTITHYKMYSTPYTLHYCTLTTHSLHTICG
jgi:hypothetical protein